MYTYGIRINAKLVKEGCFCINTKLVKEELKVMHKHKSCSKSCRNVLCYAQSPTTVPGTTSSQCCTASTKYGMVRPHSMAKKNIERGTPTTRPDLEPRSQPHISDHLPCYFMSLCVLHVV